MWRALLWKVLVMISAVFLEELHRNHDYIEYKEDVDMTFSDENADLNDIEFQLEKWILQEIENTVDIQMELKGFHEEFFTLKVPKRFELSQIFNNTISNKLLFFCNNCGLKLSKVKQPEMSTKLTFCKQKDNENSTIIVMKEPDKKSFQLTLKPLVFHFGTEIDCLSPSIYKADEFEGFCSLFCYDLDTSIFKHENFEQNEHSYLGDEQLTIINAEFAWKDEKKTDDFYCIHENKMVNLKDIYENLKNISNLETQLALVIEWYRRTLIEIKEHVITYDYIDEKLNIIFNTNLFDHFNYLVVMRKQIYADIDFTKEFDMNMIQSKKIRFILDSYFEIAELVNKLIEMAEKVEYQLNKRYSNSQFL